MSPQGWRQSILALRVPSFNSSAKTCVQGTVTGGPSKSAADRINHVSFIMALKKEIFCVQRFEVLAVHAALGLGLQFAGPRAHLEPGCRKKMAFEIVTRLHIIMCSAVERGWTLDFVKVKLQQNAGFLCRKFTTCTEELVSGVFFELVSMLMQKKVASLEVQ